MLIGFDLLDRQIVDVDGEPVGKVDDVEIIDGTAAALLSGQQVLGERIGGALGRWMAAAARRMSEPPARPPIRIPMDLIARVTSAVELKVRRELLIEPPLESWLREHLIGRIPGAHDAS